MEDTPPARIYSLSHPKGQYRQGDQLSRLLQDIELSALQPGDPQAP